MKYFTILTSAAFLGILLYIDIIKYFIRSDDFFEGLIILPLLLFSAVLFGVYYNLAFWYKLSGKTYYGAIISGIGATITVLGNIILIPIFENNYPGQGYIGAAIVTFICFLIMSIISYVLGQKHYPINYDLKRIIGYMLLAILLFLTSKFLISPLADFEKYTFNTLILLIYFSVAYYFERPSKQITN